MKAYSILKDSHPVLKQVAKNVEVFDKNLRETAFRMMATVRKANGIGLAANQVGILKRILVIDTTSSFPNGMGFCGTFVNPEIVESSKESFKDYEGCLSFPGKNYLIMRNSWVKVKYQDIQGGFHEKTFNGLTAVCLQHEIDHLNGVTFDTKKDV